MKLDKIHLLTISIGQTIFGVGPDLGKCYMKLAVPEGSWPWQEYRLEKNGTRVAGNKRSNEHMMERDLVIHKPRGADGAEGKKAGTP